jgi:hypothetical protein
MKAILSLLKRTTLLLIAASGAVALQASACAQKPESLAPIGFSLADLKAQTAQNSKGYFLLEVPQMASIALDGDVLNVLNKQLVESTGQITYQKGDSNEKPQPSLVRSQIQCCATHAREYSVGLKLPDEIKGIQERAWVRLVGSLSCEVKDGRGRAVLIVREIQEIEIPGSPLLK